jgi:transcriptional regulator with XRE-family HTH domain
MSAPPSGTPPTWGLLLTEGLQRKGWTKTRLAQELGIHRGWVGRMERGERVGSLETVVEAAELLDIDLNRLKRPQPNPAEGT